MASNKMLIDASHPEETRVAVVRGNRIEEFDFESQAKKQLRGNIYLAKVTRVEPSLQAAFIDYGGNRHGFLAFSEIHPDYYQIPMADRQALLEEEAREEAEHDELEPGSGGKRNSGKSRSRKTNVENAFSDDAYDEESSTQPDADAEFTQAGEKGVSEDSSEDNGTGTDDEDGDTRRDDLDNEDEDDEDRGDFDDKSSRTIAAAVEGDSISEPAPDDDSKGAESGESDTENPQSAEKPKRRTRRKAKSKAAEKPDPENTVDAETQPANEAAQLAADNEQAETTDDDSKPGGQSRSKKRSGGRRTRRASPVASEEADGETTNGISSIPVDEIAEEHVESVGQEDALEEVPHRRKPRRQYKIQEVIKRRQIMLVQVVKEERGNKGAALTTYLSLAGRYSVLMPNTARGGGISRKITNVSDRKRLKGIASELDVQKGMGVILRTAGASRTKAEIKRDFEYLMRLWENVRSLTLSSTAPRLVYEEGSLIKRSIRDLYDKNIEEILVSGEQGYREAKDFMRMLMPSHAKNVKEYAEEQSLFSRFGVEQQLDRLVTPQVTLKSGGYLVINQTEALVSIDVNSGRSTREHSIEDTALQTNLEAADEIARQLRLRDLAGLIVIDFIDMEENRNNRAVEKRIKEALKNDRARIQVGRISHFGLLEMSRQRIRASVMESTMEICPHCDGAGHVRSSSSIALHVFRSIEDHLTRHSRNDVVVRCPIPIAVNILNAKRAGLVELENRFGVRISVDADDTLPGQSFLIERGDLATGTVVPANLARQVGAEPEVEIEEDADEDIRADKSERSDDGGKRRRRRRRRGKRDGGEANMRDTDAADADDNEEQDDGGVSAAVGAVSADGEDEAEDKPRRRRRRGKRGGKRNRRESDETESADASDDMEAESDIKGGDSGAEQETPPSEKEPVAEDSEADGGKSSVMAESVPSQSRQTGAVREEDEPSSSAAAGQSAAVSSRGRNTRRPKTPAPHVKEAEKEVVAADTKEAKDEPKSKKSGWWSRGGGFFN